MRMEAIGSRQDASSRDVARQFGLEGTGDRTLIADDDTSSRKQGWGDYILSTYMYISLQ